MLRLYILSKWQWANSSQGFLNQMGMGRVAVICLWNLRQYHFVHCVFIASFYIPALRHGLFRVIESYHFVILFWNPHSDYFVVMWMAQPIATDLSPALLITLIGLCQIRSVGLCMNRQIKTCMLMEDHLPLSNMAWWRNYLISLEKSKKTK